MMSITKKSNQYIDFYLQNSHHWTHKLPLAVILSVITIIGLFILIFTLDALRNNIKINKKHYCIAIKKKNKKHKKEENQETQSKESESEDLWDVSNDDLNKCEENIHYKYGSMNNYLGQGPLPPIKEEGHYVEQEIKDLQGTVKSLQKEIKTHYPV